MEKEKSRLIFFSVLGVLVVLLLIFFFFTSPLHLPTSGTPNSTSTPTNSATSTTGSSKPTVTMSGQYPAGFPTELVLFQNLAPISGGSITDKMGHLHLIAQFLPEASVADVFNTYRTKLPTMGWTITTSGSVGTSTKNILLYLNASKGTETLGLTVQTIKTGTQMRLEVIQ